MRWNVIGVMLRKRKQGGEKRGFLLGQLFGCPRIKIFIQDSPRFVGMLVVVVLKSPKVFIKTGLFCKTVETHGTIGGAVIKSSRIAVLFQNTGQRLNRITCI